MGYDTTLADHDISKQFVQSRASRLAPRNTCVERNPLFVVTNGKLQVTRNNTLLLVITRGVSCQFEYLSGKVLKHGS